jgi:hypothetical protein
MNLYNHDFFFITIRARVAYAICCIENAVLKYDLQILNWDEVFEFLWRYPTSNEIKDLALWHENESEFIPLCVLGDLTYSEKMFEYLTEEQYNRFQNIYKKSNDTVCELINKTATIATQNLYSGVCDGSPSTLRYIDELIEQMKNNNILLPNIDFFNQFSYPENPKSDWIVWGDKIPQEILSQESKWINKYNLK